MAFAATTKAERNAGQWIGGQYVGYVHELKDENKIALLPGEHEISIRLANYKDLTDKVIVEPGKILVVKVKLDRDPQAHYAQGTAEVKLEVTRPRGGHP